MTLQDRVLRTLEQLGNWRNNDLVRLAQLWACAKCGAKTEAPCTNGRKKDYPHVVRQDKAIRATHRTLTEAWKGDLSDFSRTPEQVQHEIEKSPLYKRLVELGLMEKL